MANSNLASSNIKGVGRDMMRPVTVGSKCLPQHRPIDLRWNDYGVKRALSSHPPARSRTARSP
ncbi:MAG: hypothetical protein J0I75_11475, partial [Hyphomicrobium sp.]|nr:hypothetical protein [Hyphomicrobium sp.]